MNLCAKVCNWFQPEFPPCLGPHYIVFASRETKTSLAYQYVFLTGTLFLCSISISIYFCVGKAVP
jgi:hypothetical protein